MRYKLSRSRAYGMRLIFTGLASFLIVVSVVPLLGKVGPASVAQDSPASRAPQATDDRAEEGPLVPVYRAKQRKTETIPLETYVRGVVAAEMPIEFELEALKAQAMAARTYIVRRLLNGEAQDAIVTDTTSNQVYTSDDELMLRWGSGSFAANMDKLKRAVAETRDLVLTYDGLPIEASFFSTSNGYTENSEDYWNAYTPYLRSVPSPWDAQLSPKYKETVRFSAKELQSKLGLSSAVPVSSGGAGMRVLEYSAGHRVKKLAVGGKTFTGREVREKLDLHSSQFQWRFQDGAWQITTFGYGHGVGMSQWGANGMAKEGRQAAEIVSYYYTGIQIGSAAALLKAKSF